jgi:DNA-binding response OmpR family regulator
VETNIRDVPCLRIVGSGQPSQSVERGAEFPLARPGRAIRALRVLVVDDNRDAADTSSILVELWGHDVRVAYSAESAIESVATFQPDVFLLDVGLPRMSGNELAQRFRRWFREALLVAVTGYADADHRVLGEESGFDLYLAKPVAPSVLETLLLLELNRLTESRGSRHFAPTLTPGVEAVGLADRRVTFRHQREFSPCWS